MHFNAIKALINEESITIGERPYTLLNGVLKPKDIVASAAQKQTQEAFGFKWHQEDSFSSAAMHQKIKDWVIERYNDAQQWLSLLPECPLVLDAGCGAGFSGAEYWGDVMRDIRYVGVDISEAVDVACRRFAEKGFDTSVFLQENIADLPFEGPTFDVIFSEGVLHHTDNTEKTFTHLCRFLKKGGLFMFYVYRKKGPIREFTDDYVRDKMQDLSPQEGWDMLKGLTALGITLGKLDIEIDVPQEVEPFGIPPGKMSLQRFFYWHVFKAFYDPVLSFDEMHHINFDWYAPKNAHRHTVEEVREWCNNNGLEILHEKEELSGITCIARKIY